MFLLQLKKYKAQSKNVTSTVPSLDSWYDDPLPFSFEAHCSPVWAAHRESVKHKNLKTKRNYPNIPHILYNDSDKVKLFLNPYSHMEPEAAALIKLCYNTVHVYEQLNLSLSDSM